MVTNALTDLELAYRVLREEPDLADAPDAVELKANGASSVAFDDVTFFYPAGSDRGSRDSPRAGVKSITFRVEPGKMLGIAGASGSGKTTIARLLLRLFDVDSGSVSVGGYDVRNVTQASLRQSIGTVPQDPALFNETLRFNISFGVVDRQPSDAEIYAAANAAALGPFIERLPEKLDTLVGERGVRLSGGERARVGIARALIKQPKLLLMDEPSSSVDVITEKRMQDSISKLCEGRTTVVVAHRLSTIKDADEIIVMDGGVIAERGTHQELLELGGVYNNMWEIQTRFQ